LTDSAQGRNGDSGPAWIVDYEEGLQKYRMRDFRGAICCLEVVLRQRPHDRPTELMLDRCRHLEKSGVEDGWSPIVALQSK
jgi:adenylate cyclase